LTNKKQHTLGKDERLKSRKTIEQLFKQGKSFSIFPLRIVYVQMDDKDTPLKAGFTVSTRHFKKAVDRNRIKRQMKEAYRLQKIELKNQLQQQQKSLAVFFMYTGNELPEYLLISDKIKNALHRLIKTINEVG
jgi:ribonuclease P protein component